MRKLLLMIALMCFAGELVAQAVDPPAGYTANYRFRKYNEGDYPSADSLNNDKDSIDAKIKRPGWTQQDSLQLHKSNKTITLVPPTIKASYGITFPDSLPTGAEFLWLMNATGTLSYIDRDSLGTSGGSSSASSVTDTIWLPIWSSANDTLPNASVTEAEFYSSGTTRTKAYAYYRKDSLTNRIRFWGEDTNVGAGSGTAELYVNDSLLISRAFSSDGTFINEASLDHISDGTLMTVKVSIVLGGGNNHAFKDAAIELARAVVVAGGTGLASDVVDTLSVMFVPATAGIISTSSTTTLWSSDTTMRVVMFEIPHAFRVDTVYHRQQAASANDTIVYALYDRDGDLKWRTVVQLTDGSTTGTYVMAVVTPVLVPAGTYYWAWMQSGGYNPSSQMSFTDAQMDALVSMNTLSGYGLPAHSGEAANKWSPSANTVPATLGTITRRTTTDAWVPPVSIMVGAK